MRIRHTDRVQRRNHPLKLTQKRTDGTGDATMEAEKRTTQADDGDWQKLRANKTDTHAPTRADRHTDRQTRLTPPK